MCALNGVWRCGLIVYRATVEHSSKTNEGTSTKIYEESNQELKPRLANHEASCRNENLKNATTLSNYTWTKI